jgi:hypothetical protein
VHILTSPEARVEEVYDCSSGCAESGVPGEQRLDRDLLRGGGTCMVNLGQLVVLWLVGALRSLVDLGFSAVDQVVVGQTPGTHFLCG